MRLRLAEPIAGHDALSGEELAGLLGAVPGLAGRREEPDVVLLEAVVADDQGPPRPRRPGEVLRRRRPVTVLTCPFPTVRASCMPDMVIGAVSEQW